MRKFYVVLALLMVFSFVLTACTQPTAPVATEAPEVPQATDAPVVAPTAEVVETTERVKVEFKSLVKETLAAL